MRFLFNANIAKLLAAILGLVTASYFAWGFYYFGEWVGQHFLGEIPGGAQTLAILCAVIMFLAVLYVFFYIEYTKEDVHAYEDDRGDGSFHKALKQLQWAVLCLEVGSLLFRWWSLSWTFSGLILVIIGLGLLWLSHVLGKVLHAQINRPQDIEADRIMHKAGMRIWQGLGKEINHMNVDQLRRIASGDPSPLDEIKDLSTREREMELSRAEQRRQENQERRSNARGFATHFLTPRNETRVLEEPQNPFDRNRRA